MHGPMNINTLNAKLNAICHLLVLLGARHILHVSRIRVKTNIFVRSSCVREFLTGKGKGNVHPITDHEGLQVE
jgi:hypothetical protein